MARERKILQGEPFVNAMERMRGKYNAYEEALTELVEKAEAYRDKVGFGFSPGDTNKALAVAITKAKALLGEK